MFVPPPDTDVMGLGYWLTENSEAIRDYSIAVVAFVGLIFAFWQSGAARDQAGLARKQHASELFNRSVEQLGSDKLEIRLAGVYTLTGLAVEYADLDFKVYELFQAVMRDRSSKSLLIDEEDYHVMVSFLFSVIE